MKYTYEPVIFENLIESIDLDGHIIATYYFNQAEVLDHLEIVGFMSLEASTGGWMDFPGETPEVRRNMAAKIVGFYPVPAGVTGSKAAIVQLAFPIKGPAGWGESIPMLLTAVAGNILSMPGEVYLQDIRVPRKFAAAFPGPKFGVKGIRELLCVPDRPLVNMMVKPKVGLPAETIGNMCYEAAMGGVDHIKDDEMASEVFNCSFDDRLHQAMAGLKRAYEESGKKAIYTINVTDQGTKTIGKAKRAVEAGANALMVNFPAGFEALRTLAADPEINVPILFHPTHSSAVKSISRVVWAKLARLCGGDIYLPGSAWGKWSGTEDIELFVRSKHALQAEFYGMPRTFALESSVAGKVPVFVADMGKDIILGGGGAIHGHPGGIRAGVKAIRQAIDAVMQGISLTEYAKDHAELKASVDAFGTFQRPKEKRY